MIAHKVPFSELAMHLGIAGKYIFDFRVNSLNSVGVRVVSFRPDGSDDDTYYNGLHSELLPFELREYAERKALERAQ